VTKVTVNCVSDLARFLRARSKMGELLSPQKSDLRGFLRYHCATPSGKGHLGVFQIAPQRRPGRGKADGKPARSCMGKSPFNPVSARPRAFWARYDLGREDWPPVRAIRAYRERAAARDVGGHSRCASGFHPPENRAAGLRRGSPAGKRQRHREPRSARPSPHTVRPRSSKPGGSLLPSSWMSTPQR
jgi:hypothetical protein